ncbi:hypothetical protein ACFQ3K_15440 [Brucella gallinifaecis]|uniref:DUF1127 domain-containing protein n=1 Tax=Brucella gallinifaecis TaxID=215590 RepID=A0A502BKD8_9HYPH|nr:hypothetical protein [Brucella gallinifaecis]TPF74942.1 hypothetical protein FHY56_11435 [Brucella gallinifaecis]
MAFAIAPLLAILKEYRRRKNARKRFVLTQRTLDNLPGELRKDIGWPERYLEQQQQRNGE